MRVCIVGASGKLGQYMVQHALDRGYEVVGVCREQSVEKLDAFKERITVVPGATDDRDVIKQAVAGCDGVLVVLVPRGVHGYSSGTAQAVLDHAQPGARLVFSSGWHITRDGKDVYSWKLRLLVKVFTPLARLVRFADLDDQVEACRRVFASDTRWTVVRGSDLEEGDSQGLPGVEPPRGRSDPREQPHAPHRFRAVHGGRSRERGSRPRGPGDRRLPDALGTRARRLTRQLGSNCDPTLQLETALALRGSMRWAGRPVSGIEGRKPPSRRARNEPAPRALRSRAGRPPRARVAPPRRGPRPTRGSGPRPWSGPARRSR